MAAAGTTRTTADVRNRVEDLFRAMNEHAVDKIVAMHTTDAVLEDPNLAEPAEGREAIAAEMAAMFRAFPDLHFVMDELEVYQAGATRAAARWHVVGTMTGPIDPPGFAPTGKQASFSGACFYKFRRGLIEHHTIVYDSMGMLQQLGIMPVPGSTSAKLTVGLQRAFAEVSKLARR